MTRVRLTQDPGRHYAVTCEGHATGSPEVCAAISCLVGSLEGWVENSPSADVQHMEIRPGFVQIVFTPAAGPDSAPLVCQGVYDLLQIGFLRLEAAAPDLLCVEREEN
mgnify:FL=1